MPSEDDLISQRFSRDGALPPRLHDALSQAYGKTAEVPPHIDRLILSAARAGLARRRRTARMVRWIAAGAAAAAVIVMSTRTAMIRPSGGSRPQVTQVGDVNHDGRVDILDAYLVARAIATHERLNPAWDVNGDGTVDQKDVDWIAGVAVNVSGGGTPR